MGEQKVSRSRAERARDFIEAVLRDFHALDRLIEDDLIETGVRRIGAEQELFLVDRRWRPAPINLDVLERLDDPAFTTELGRFNLEFNLDPLEYEGRCLSRLETDLRSKLQAIDPVLEELGAHAVMTGILPTLRASDLGMENMTPRDRYLALDAALKRHGGGRYQLRLKGIDELFLELDTVMLEAACTSFQVHLQVDPADFPTIYNAAQLAAAPVLAAAVNSPLLFGRRLWDETRIPLFQQSIDTRDASYHLRERRPRVGFGSGWVDESILQLFAHDIGRFRALLAIEPESDPFEQIAEGEAPELSALQVYNGTVYRWNRPCYGVLDGKPHIRIELRVLPAGPSVVDEVANAAFFYGLVDGLCERFGNIAELMSFHQARGNFLAAAEYGLKAQFRWLDGRMVPALQLIREELLPMARDGLASGGIDAADIDRYIGIVEDRVESRLTGAKWQIGSIWRLNEQRATKDRILTALTAAIAARQRSGEPVHRWQWAELEEGGPMAPDDTLVEEFMTTDVYTVAPEEPISLAAHMMEWRHVRHMPVEEGDGTLVGIVSCFDVIRQYGSRPDEDGREQVPVREVMCEPVTVGPETTMSEAIRLMRDEKVSCLAVVRGERIVGIVTEHDFVHIVARLLEDRS